MSPSTPNRLSSNEVSGLEVDHRHIDRTVEVRSRLPDTLLISVNEQLCSNSNPGRSEQRARVRIPPGALNCRSTCGIPRPPALPSAAEAKAAGHVRPLSACPGNDVLAAEPAP